MPVYVEPSHHLPFSERGAALLFEQARRNTSAWRDLCGPALAGLTSHVPGTNVLELPPDLIETVTQKLASSDIPALHALLYRRLSPQGQSSLVAGAARAAGFVRRPRGNWDAHLAALAKNARPGVFFGLLTHGDAVLAGVLLGSLAPHTAITHYKPSRAIAVAAVARCGSLINLLPTALQYDPAVLRSAFFEGGARLAELDAHFASHREAVLWAVKADATMLLEANPVFIADREVMLVAVAQRGDFLAYASEAICNDHAVVSTAVEQHPSAFKHASLALREDRMITLAAVHKDGSMFLHAGPTMAQDRKVALCAVRQWPVLMMHIKHTFADDREILIAAVRKQPWLIAYASERLKQDLELRRLAKCKHI